MKEEDDPDKWCEERIFNEAVAQAAIENPDKLSILARLEYANTASDSGTVEAVIDDDFFTFAVGQLSMNGTDGSPLIHRIQDLLESSLLVWPKSAAYEEDDWQDDEDGYADDDDCCDFLK